MVDMDQNSPERDLLLPLSGYGEDFKEHLCLVGIVIATWNRIEFSTGLLLKMLAGWDARDAIDYLAANTGFGIQAKYLQKLSNIRLSEKSADGISYFVKGASDIKEIRDFVAHSFMVPTGTGELVSLSKQSRSATTSETLMSLEDLSQITDQADRYARYGYGLWISLSAEAANQLNRELPVQLHPLEALPEKPPQPRTLREIQQAAHQHAPPLPQSSPG